MSLPLRPKLRRLEFVPVGAKEECLLALRDPEGFGEVTVLPTGAAMLAVLMNGRRTLSQVQAAFRVETGVAAAMTDVEQVVGALDEARLLDNQHFCRYRRELIEGYLNNPVRSASHAGGAYCDDPETLRQELDAMFAGDGGPGPIDPKAVGSGSTVRGILSPHIDPNRGAAAFAWAYKTLAEQSRAEVFVIFGTAHNPMNGLFCASRKDFDTPLGIVRTDQGFIDRLAADLSSSVAGRAVDLFEDELVHRSEHSIEFQAMFLQYALGGRRPFRIVPILVGSLHEFVGQSQLPGHSPEVQAFFAAVRTAAGERPEDVCYISGADFAHIGQRFGDSWLLDEERLAAQSEDDRKLLALACRCNASAFFRHVARQQDRSRICGLAPTYTMLEVLGSARGRLLKYGQAVEPDGTACVSFASAAFYER